MNCPFCDSDKIEIPTVDIGVGEIQCGGAICLNCMSYQTNEGVWEQWKEEECKADDLKIEDCISLKGIIK